MTQQTLGIVALDIKQETLEQISADKKQLKITSERQLELSVEASLRVLNHEIDQPLGVYGFILEGTDAVQDWLSIANSTATWLKSNPSFIHASTLQNVDKEIDWFHSLMVKELSIEKASQSPSSSIPIKVRAQHKTKTATVSEVPQKKTLRGTTAQQQRPAVSRLTQSTSPTTTTNTQANRKSTTPAINSTRSKIPNARTRATKPVAPRPTTTATTKIAKSSSPIMTHNTPTNLSKRANASDRTAASGNGRKGSSTSSTVTASTSKKLLTTTSKGGVIKSTPPVSVLTGRTRKPSRLTEKRPQPPSTTAASKTSRPAEKKVLSKKQVEKKAPAVQEAEKKEEEPIVEEQVTPTAVTETSSEHQEDTTTITTTTTTTADVTVLEEAQPKVEEEQEPATATDTVAETPLEDPVLVTDAVQEQLIVSYPSTCSSAATDEHDAEVAAATSKNLTMDTETAPAATTVPLMTHSGRSSFSPNSLASLPRPETPEVDQLRLRFESIIQTSAPTAQELPRRPSAKISPEFVSRIKEMKPKGPAGTKVKSMVELFMDENLNKWEF